ncbi:ABC transporter ATP-binding protein [Algibacter sp. L1A34]|uniref:ATP-binding cassette domain-containing protein n=1 Tax=Algibacter sp. L1A34 TaxID=2686365 RepID=UPI00131DC682|nr:ABC transporter ATP-binding protein [Algibacter sp. L1A34]
MIFEIDNIELSFKDKRILNGIYLKAETGKITGISGSNGCGKTCLLKILFGNLESKYKLIRVDNKPILKPLYQTRLVGYLPQHYVIPKYLKVKTVFWLFKVSWKDFTVHFETFGHYRKTKLGKLSGGERRLIETYIILKSNTKLILLDEPFTHLSPINIEGIKKVISEEKQHKAIIITDHLYKHILELADAIYFIKNGNSKLIKGVTELEDLKYLNPSSFN